MLNQYTAEQFEIWFETLQNTHRNSNSNINLSLLFYAIRKNKSNNVLAQSKQNSAIVTTPEPSLEELQLISTPNQLLLPACKEIEDTQTIRLSETETIEYWTSFPPGELINGIIDRNSVGGVTFCWDDKTVYCIEFNEIPKHVKKGKTKANTSNNTYNDSRCEMKIMKSAGEDEVNKSELWFCIEYLLTSSKITKISMDCKSLIQVCLALRINIQGPYKDIRIAYWMIEPESKYLVDLEYLYNLYCQNFACTAKVRQPDEFQKYEIFTSKSSSIQAVSQQYLVMQQLKYILVSRNQRQCFELVEMPIIPILADMEYNGIQFDRTRYLSHSYSIHTAIQFYTQCAYHIVGREFNMSAGAYECGEILFDQLKLPEPTIAKSKTKSGRRKTTQEVLKWLVKHCESPLPTIILEWRKLTKVMESATNIMSKLRHNKDNTLCRVHTRLLQTHSSTGRIITLDPNIHSIPKHVTYCQINRLSLQQEMDSGIIAISQLRRRICIKSQQTNEYIEATPSQLLVQSLNASNNQYTEGIIQAIPNQNLTAPYSSHSVCVQSLADYWRSKGYNYTEKEAHHIKVVQIKLKFVHNTEASRVFSYPADKVFRIGNFPREQIENALKLMTPNMSTTNHNNGNNSNNNCNSNITALSEDAEDSDDEERGLNPLLFDLEDETEKIARNSMNNDEDDFRKVSFSLRDCFIIGPNYYFISADYTNYELRILTHLSNDQAMSAILNNENEDIFKLVAAQILGINQDSVSEQSRNQAKQLIYGIVYGAGIHSIANSLNISPSAAKEFLASFRAKFPTIMKHIDLVQQECVQNGYVRTIFDRIRPLEHIRSGNRDLMKRAQRQAISTQCQGSAADLLKAAMINCSKKCIKFNQFYCYSGTKTKNIYSAGYACRFLLQFHDELQFEIHHSLLEEFARLIQYTMESTVRELNVRFPFSVRIKYGQNWGELQPLKLTKTTDNDFNNQFKN